MKSNHSNTLKVKTVDQKIDKQVKLDQQINCSKVGSSDLKQWIKSEHN